MLYRNNAPVGKTATVAGTIDVVDNRRFYVTAAQEIGMQRMRDPALNGVLRR